MGKIGYLVDVYKLTVWKFENLKLNENEICIIAFAIAGRPTNNKILCEFEMLEHIFRNLTINS
jgi:hypothetical protein